MMYIYSISHLNVWNAALFTVHAVSDHVNLMSLAQLRVIDIDQLTIAAFFYLQTDTISS